MNEVTETNKENDTTENAAESKTMNEAENDATEHIANYFEELYKAREVSEQQKAWTKVILETNRTTKDRIDREDNLPPIEGKEMEKMKRKLKKKKSCGPDNIPN